MFKVKFLAIFILSSYCLVALDYTLYAAQLDKETITSMTDQDWKEKLNDEQYKVMREEGTEPAFTSPLNDEKRNGIFVCAACGAPLFSSQTKFDSQTGWPSFYDAIEQNIETDKDYRLLYARTEFHCAKCGGHLGHIFEDGPDPTGLRYCTNGLALKFIPEQSDN